MVKAALPLQGAQVQYPGGELRSRVAQPKNKNK